MPENQTRGRRASYVRPRRTHDGPDVVLLMIALTLVSIALGLASYAYVLVVWGGR